MVLNKMPGQSDLQQPLTVLGGLSPNLPVLPGKPWQQDRGWFSLWNGGDFQLFRCAVNNLGFHWALFISFAEISNNRNLLWAWYHQIVPYLLYASFRKPSSPQKHLKNKKFLKLLHISWKDLCLLEILRVRWELNIIYI